MARTRNKASRQGPNSGYARNGPLRALPDLPFLQHEICCTHVSRLLWMFGRLSRSMFHDDFYMPFNASVFSSVIGSGQRLILMIAGLETQ